MVCPDCWLRLEVALKILIFGAGVLGSLYAGRLAAAGQDIALLARGARLKQLQQDGLVLLDEATGHKARPQVRVVAELQPEDAYDLVVVAVRAEQLANALLPLAANRRVPCILLLQNHASGTEALTGALGPDRVLLGFPGASGAREGETVRYQLIPQQESTLGELSGHVTPRLREIAAAPPRRAAWNPKPAATFADAIARLRQHLWFERIVTSTADTDMTEPISPAVQRIIEAACYAP